LPPNKKAAFAALKRHQLEPREDVFFVHFVPVFYISFLAQKTDKKVATIRVLKMKNHHPKNP